MTTDVKTKQHLLSLVDLTSLNESDTQDIIAALCKNAVTFNGHVAAVCVYPVFVKQAKQLLATTAVKIATVVNFPEGAVPLQETKQAIQQAIADGADEIDVVFPYPLYLAGNKQDAYDYIHQCKKICGDHIALKVILETGVLAEDAVIAEASEAVCRAGADFLKTSTGKVNVGATIEAATVMLRVIQKMTAELKRPIGLKVSGGIRTIPDALQYVELASAIFGASWVTPANFRIGASRLIEHL